ncbi:hypothetical protein BD289DRAFT_472967 [Coniella lustricola]|uniref:Adenylyltransferase and sulfurtransferase uba4 n=1 Tax=Coniella lustricola TaxID=2025994 RepID=A0A2T3AD95_9PEZI|nr:hypothetical protein BD289DRAFT_472967 [Coniella lustricola]
MKPSKVRAAQLRERICKAENELQALKEQLAEVEAAEEANEGLQLQAELQDKSATEQSSEAEAAWKWPLEAQEYERYGRQLILPHVGIQGQLRLKACRVLIVGAGGLGCPAAAYLAGAGVGTLGVVDGDVVEPSNLHRQIAHGTSRVGLLKVDSLIAYCKELNPFPIYKPHRHHLTPENAQVIVGQYDIVLDCTDHPTSRYLISDICVLLQKSLVSASALRTDGQLILLNTPPTAQGVLSIPSSPSNSNPSSSSLPPAAAPPCYRCVFPTPPPPEAVVSCGEGGVLGPVVGVMGVLQALEAIKVIATGLHLPSTFSPFSSSSSIPQPPQPTLLLFSGNTPGTPTFRSIRMRTRRQTCFACGEDSKIRLTLAGLASGSLDYVAFCGGAGTVPVKLLADEQRVSARDFYANNISNSKAEKGQAEEGADEGKGEGKIETVSCKQHILLDVRERELFDVASIAGAVNVPYSMIQTTMRRRKAKNKQNNAEAQMQKQDSDNKKFDNEEEANWEDWIPASLKTDDQKKPIYVVCRVGNDSQLVAKRLLELGLGANGRWIGDIKGGMRAWRNEVDATLPFL